MHTVELYAHVRRYVAVDHHSQRAAARHFGISRDMVANMLKNAQPPGYRRTALTSRSLTAGDRHGPPAMSDIFPGMLASIQITQ